MRAPITRANPTKSVSFRATMRRSLKGSAFFVGLRRRKMQAMRETPPMGRLIQKH